MNIVDIPCTAEGSAHLPSYKTKGAAGADIAARLASPVTIPKGGRAVIPTGLSFAIPDGFEIQVRPRSGLAAKHGVTVLNSPGTIDSDYRGELKVILANFGDEPFTVNDGDRIAQMVVAHHETVEWTPVEQLNETERGAGGFGHSGEK